MTRSDLLEVVYRFYPRGVPAYDPAYDQSEERRRLADAARRGAAEYPKWDAMFKRLAQQHKVQNESMFLRAGGIDPAYSARLYLPGEDGEIALTFHVSLLGPYYGVHRTGEPGEEEAADIAREIEATYPGYQPIPPDIGDYMVPDAAVESRMFGEDPIYVFIFSKVWEWAGVLPPPDGLLEALAAADTALRSPS